MSRIASENEILWPAAGGPAPVDNRRVYNERWEDWERMKHTGPMSRHTRRLVAKSLRPITFKSVLDVGCGPGVFLRFLADRFPGLELSGTDVSEMAVSLARKQLPSADLRVNDITKEPPPGEFDLVAMIDVAEHIEDDLAAFRNVRQCCRGYFLISTLEGRMRPFEAEVGHVRNYAPGELTRKLETAGFSVVSLRRWGWPFYSPLYRNLNNVVKPHNLAPGNFSKLAGILTYWALMLSLPFKGDLAVLLARPRPEAEARKDMPS
jgi:SAM-dependent methyltransferase